MGRKNNRAYLQDMLDSARFLRAFVEGRTEPELSNDFGFRLAVERGLQIIGEAAYQLRRSDPTTLSEIDESDRIIAMRHVLVHGYDEIKLSVLWEVVTEKLDPLIQDIEAILDRSNGDTP